MATQVQSGLISQSAVSSSTIADGAVSSSTIADGAVVTADLANGALAASTAGRAKMADLFVTTEKINNGAVTRDKLSPDAAVPTGAVFYFAASTAPLGYLICDGTTIPAGIGTVQGVTANFSSLHSLIGSTYGAAGKLPDLRGEFIRGWDKSRGVDSGRSFGSSQGDDFKSHNHTFTTDGTGLAGRKSSGLDNAFRGNGIADVTFSINYSGGTETRPRNIALLPCIKY